MSHSHGRVECKSCEKIVMSCRCMEAGKTVEYVICPECKAKEALERQKEMSAMNQKLKEMGVSAISAGENILKIT